MAQAWAPSIILEKGKKIGVEIVNILLPLFKSEFTNERGWVNPRTFRTRHSRKQQLQLNDCFIFFVFFFPGKPLKDRVSNLRNRKKTLKHGINITCHAGISKSNKRRSMSNSFRWVFFAKFLFNKSIQSNTRPLPLQINHTIRIQKRTTNPTSRRRRRRMVHHHNHMMRFSTRWQIHSVSSLEMSQRHLSIFINCISQIIRRHCPQATTKQQTKKKERRRN
mmetsp:Transcript_43755/g.61515  ORF Transcript_43755/g.61515 Transcript_43755/m.61515 type:complete len:221 (-) Transcript_43755:192-854(-)